MEFHKLVDNHQYPKLSKFIEDHLNKEFEDLRSLLQLPKGELNAGCNVTTASMILNLISGLSVCLYDASFDHFMSKNTTGRGERFKGLLLSYYPWQSEPIPRETSPISKEIVVKVLYSSLRNPLTHCLGLYKPGEKDSIIISKSPMDIAQISELENNKARPQWLNPTIQLSRSVYHYEIDVNTLYWGVHRLIENLLSDKCQMIAAENFHLQLETQRAIIGLKATIESISNTPRSSQQYTALMNGMKHGLDFTLGFRNQLTKGQVNDLERMRKAYNRLT